MNWLIVLVLHVLIPGAVAVARFEPTSVTDVSLVIRMIKVSAVWFLFVTFRALVGTEGVAKIVTHPHAPVIGRRLSSAGLTGI